MNVNRDFEYLSSNTFVAHPFLEENEIARVTVDAYVAPAVNSDLEVQLVNLDDPRGASPAVRFEYTNGSVAFSSVGATISSRTMGPWRIVEWVGTGVARMLFLEAELASISWPITDLDAVLVGSTVQPPVASVSSLQALGSIFGAGSTVELVAGNNVVLREETVDDIGLTVSPRTMTRVVLEVDPGAGEGKYVDCDPERDQGIYTINGTGPDETGRFTLAPIDCYKLEVPTTGTLVDAEELYQQLNTAVEGTNGVKDLFLISFEVTIEGTLDGLPYTATATDTYLSRSDAIEDGKQTAEQLGLTNVSVSVTQLSTIDWAAMQLKIDSMTSALNYYRQEADAGNKDKGPPWYMVRHSLHLQNDCQPCCDCDDYVWVYDTLMRSVYERAKTMAARFQALKDDYIAMIAKMEQEKLCREGPRISLRFSSYSGWTSSLTILIKNNQPCTVENFTLTGSFSGAYTARITKIAGSTNDGSTVPLGTSTYPDFEIPYNGTVLGAKTVTITIDVYYLEGGGRAAGLPISVSVSGTIAGYPVAATASTTMRGPSNKDTV
jgi:hypothetical protein